MTNQPEVKEVELDNDEDTEFTGTSDSVEEQGEEIISSVTIGDEVVEQVEDTTPAPLWVKDLRIKNREAQKKIKELEEALKSKEAPNEILTIGKEPELDDPEIDYDQDKFKKAIIDWHSRKQEISNLEANRIKEQEAERQVWIDAQKKYASDKESIKLPDFEDAEEKFDDCFTPQQKAIICAGSDEAVLLVYALGNNPKKAKELSEIKDFSKFAIAIGKLEAQLKVTKQKSIPSPERIVSGGSGVVSSSTSSTLEKLREEAQKTGDFTKLIQFKKAQKIAQNG